MSDGCAMAHGAVTAELARARRTDSPVNVFINDPDTRKRNENTRAGNWQLATSGGLAAPLHLLYY
jgi:hypothetical protein